MFRGASTKGINREVLAVLECAELNRRNVKQSLAQPALCVVQMARNLLEQNEKITKMMDFSKKGTPDNLLVTSNLDVLSGILPGLRYIVMKQLETMNLAGFTPLHFKKRITKGKNVINSATEETQNGDPADTNEIANEGSILNEDEEKRYSFEYDTSLRRDKKPNAFQNPAKFPVDPYGVTGFFCQLCHMELSNMYLHCEGCEIILNKDFNICLRCYQEERDKVFVKMHPTDCDTLSSAHHTGNYPKASKAGSCKPKEFTKCKYCQSCPCCSCSCHLRYSAHLRFFNEENEEAVLKRVEEAVGKDADERDETFQRLHQAATGTSFEEIKKRSDPEDDSGTEKGGPRVDNGVGSGGLKDNICQPVKEGISSSGDGKAEDGQAPEGENSEGIESTKV